MAATASNATANLTIRYPTGFARVNRGLSTQRKAAYVNPTAGNFLNIYVDGNLIPGGAVNVTATPDSTQLVQVPLVSSNQNVITVQEWDNNGHELASGGTGPNPIAAGGTATPTVTLSMNATAMGVTTDAVAGSDALLINTTTQVPTPFCLTASKRVYAFAADPSAGYVLPGTPAGNGGIPAPALTSTVPTAGTSRFGAQSVGYYMGFDASNDGVAAFFSQTNPLAGGVNGAVQFFYAPDCTQATVITNLVNVNSVTLPFQDVFDNIYATPFPVIAYGGYTYWPFTNINNPEAFDLAKFDSRYNLISVTSLGGDRYIWYATVNTVAGSVTFFGQNANCCGGMGVTVTYAQLSSF